MAAEPLRRYEEGMGDARFARAAMRQSVGDYIGLFTRGCLRTATSPRDGLAAGYLTCTLSACEEHLSLLDGYGEG
ncbi:hypothetical protein Cflav_PD2535 [Pedosphaera parvula Ellin514]|uniref:Uncharacterized protein n=1 Tax=Pedosphaera parvula (strain Ellin514) TaxID=320771 RepID=B9XK76_PEDPL|nr:hypothetical protein Cflav_PD2535 [Pedosphaera parvula Ellin514]